VTTDFFVRTPMSSEGFGGTLAADATNLYWTDYFKGTITKLAFAGGPTVTLALGLNHPNDLLVDGATLYFASDDGIGTVPAAGGAVTTLCTTTGGITKDGNDLYVANDGSLALVDATTGAATVLAAGVAAASSPVLTANRILWLHRGSQYAPPLGSLSFISRP
jgi:sugar lactone lactonase YvrE